MLRTHSTPLVYECPIGLVTFKSSHSMVTTLNAKGVVLKQRDS